MKHLFKLNRPPNPQKKFIRLHKMELIGIFPVIVIATMGLFIALTDPLAPLAHFLFFGSALSGALARGIITMDKYLLSKKISGSKLSSLSNYTETILGRTPLRFLSINRISLGIDRIIKKQLKKDLKAIQRTGCKNGVGKEVKLRQEEEKAYNTIKNLADQKRHLRRITVLLLSVFTVSRMLTDPSLRFILDLKKTILRVVGLLSATTYAAGQLDVYLQKNVRSPKTRPFFVLLERKMSKLPTRHLSNALIRLDQKRLALIKKDGTTSLLIDALAKLVPFNIAKNWLKRSFSISVTPAVNAKIAQNTELSEALETLTSFDPNIRPSKNDVPEFSIRRAWKDVVARYPEEEEQLRKDFEKYRKSIIIQDTMKKLCAELKKQQTKVVASTVEKQDSNVLRIDTLPLYPSQYRYQFVRRV